VGRQVIPEALWHLLADVDLSLREGRLGQELLRGAELVAAIRRKADEAQQPADSRSP
jgi:hypothetical protein